MDLFFSLKEVLDKIVFEDTEYVYDGTEKRLETKEKEDCLDEI